MIAGYRRDIFKVALFVPLAIVATILALSGAGIVSLTYQTRLGVHSILAYWAALPTAVLAICTKKESALSRFFFLSAFLFYIFIQIDHALGFLYAGQGMTSIEPTNLVMTLFELSLTGILLFGGIVTSKYAIIIQGRKQAFLAILLMLSIPLAAYGGFYYYITSSLFSPLNPIVPIGIAAHTSAIFLFLSLVIGVLSKDLNIDRGYFASASILVATASALILNSHLNGSDAWIYAENLIIAALFLFGASFCSPYLNRLSYRRLTRYLIIISLAVAAHLPLLITTIIESIHLTNPLEIGNLLAYSIIHIGAGTLSAIMAILLFAYSRLRPAPSHFYLVILFVVWTSVAATSLLSILIFGTLVGGEPTIPYFVGGLLTIVILYRIQCVLRDGKQGETPSPTIPRLFVTSLVFSISVLLGEVVNQALIRLYPTLQTVFLGNAFLLVCNYYVFLAFVYVLLLFASTSKGRLSFEMYVIAFLTFWIVPITLKSFYSIFTPGWWVSEILLFVNLLIGPSILVILYINAARDVRLSHQRARLYADLLMHDITNYNQMSLTTLELLSSGDLSVLDQERLLSDARTAVSLTEQLIENVRLLNESDNWADRPIKPMNLIATMVSALDVVTHSPRRPDTLVRFKPAENRAYVMANELLFGAILNLLYVALEIPSSWRELTVKIESDMNRGRPFWNVTIEIPYSMTGSDEISRKIGPSPIGYLENTLGFQVARLIVRQIKGSLMTTQVQTDVDLMDITITLKIPLIEELE